MQYIKNLLLFKGEKMRIMILGASGYLGKKVKSYLMASGNIITGTYRKIPNNNIESNEKCIGDSLDEIREELSKATYDVIINCVAVYEKNGTPLHDIINANIIFALRVLNYAVEYSIDKFITIDTSLPKKLNIYSFAKKQFAEFGKYYAEKYKITFINIVLEMFYGEDEPDGRFILDCCKKMLYGENLFLTEGTQKRDIIYIDDVCEAMKLLSGAKLQGFCEVPVGSGKTATIREILEYIHRILDSDSELYFGAIPMRQNEPNCIADITWLESMGFKPQYSWKKGLEHVCHTLKEHLHLNCCENIK